MSSLDWKDKTWAYNWLKSMANNNRMSIVEWLRSIGVIPEDVRWKRAPMSVYNGLDPNGISAKALAELAYEFDKEGEATPREYMTWLEYEIKGHPRREQFMAVLSTLGKRGPNPKMEAR